MEKIRIEHLIPLASLDRPLYDLGGQLLAARGTRLTRPVMRALKLAGIDEGVLLDDLSERRKLPRQRQYERRNIKTLIPGQIITEAMFDEQGRLLLAADSVIPAGLVENLRERDLTSVLLYKEPDVDQARRFTGFLAHEWVREFDRAIDAREIALAVERKGVPVARRMRIWRGKLRPPLDLLRISRKRESLLDEADEILDILRVRGEVKKGRIERFAAELVDLVCDDKDVCLALATFPDAGADMSRTAVNVAFIAVAVALMMGYNEAQVHALAMGAFLHDIGMLTVPREVVEKEGRLNRDELEIVRSHPVGGLSFLALMPDATIETGLAIYQSHERESGVGYPAGTGGEGIHDFAKIVGIADTYHALVNPRAHRDESLPHDALMNVVKMGKLGMFAREFVLALVHASGSFPVGSWVKLATGEIARVAAVSPATFDRPKVSVIINEFGNVLEEPRVDDLSVTPGIDFVHVRTPVRLMDDPLVGFGPHIP